MVTNLGWYGLDEKVFPLLGFLHPKAIENVGLSIVDRAMENIHRKRKYNSKVKGKRNARQQQIKDADLRGTVSHVSGDV